MHGNTPRLIRSAILTAAVVAAFGSSATNAQQDVPFANGVPVAPTGLANQPLGKGPWTYPTAEGMDIRVEVVVRGIEYPMALAFTPDEELLLVTRPGKLLRIVDGQVSEISGTPDSVFRGESGALGTSHGYIDIALHPDFADNGYIYLSYTKPMLGSDSGSIAIGRGHLVGNTVQDFEDIWGGNGETGGVTRLAFAQDGTLFATTGGNDPQDLGTVGGKVLRLNDDGSIPVDNPYVNTDGARPEVYSYGHRSALGLTIHPTSGQLWQNENGPNGGDEVNIIQPGVNYGWPLESLGRTYQGPWQSERPSHHRFEPPVVYWMPAIAVSGMEFYTGDVLSKWQGDLFVGALRTGEIPGTGHLERILLNENMEELRRETLLTDLHQRIRDVIQGPDGYLYLATDERDGAVLRIMPAQ